MPAALAAVGTETVAASVQGSLGFGINVVAVPFLVLVDPRFVPAPVIIAGLAGACLVAVRERGQADTRGVLLAAAGRIPGSVAGAAAVALAGGPALRGIVGVLAGLGTVTSSLGWRLQNKPGSLVGAGLVSGLMGTVAGLGGPPVALLYQDQAGPVVRATLSRYGVIGSLLSLAALAAYGKVSVSAIELSAVLMPGVIAGYLVSGRLRPFLDRKILRPAMLGLAGAASAAVIAQAVHWP